MNRAARRASTPRANPRQMRLERPRPDPTTWAQVLQANKVNIDPEIANAVLVKIHDAFRELRSGRPTIAQAYHYMQTLAGAINSAVLRAESIDATLAGPLDAAVDAMQRAENRREQLGRYGFDGPGLQAITVGLEIYEEILRNSSEKQMVDAEAESARRALVQFQQQHQAQRHAHA